MVLVTKADDKNLHLVSESIEFVVSGFTTIVEVTVVNGLKFCICCQ